MIKSQHTQNINHLIGSTILAGICLVGFQSPCRAAGIVAGGFAKAPSTPYSNPAPAASETASTLSDNLPKGTPAYFKKTYLSLMRSPLPAKIYNQGGIPLLVPQLEIDSDPFGKIGTYQPKGPTLTTGNAFFQSLGENGRSCATCHQPPSGMSVSVRNIKQRLQKTRGLDPIFAPVDGANCPNQVAAAETSGSLYGGYKGKGKKAFNEAHSLLINKGLIRVALPVPVNAQFSISVVSDPTTCNLDPNYNSLADGTRIVSTFRRPLISTNLDFKTTTLFPGPGGNSGNVMWDGREPTLRTQAVSAILGHAQAIAPPTEKQIDQIVEFETNIFSAQYSDSHAGLLTAAGATGGPVFLADIEPGQLEGIPPTPPTFTEFDAWLAASGSNAKARQSIARGQELFTSKTFTISNVRGFNDIVGNPAPGNTCATCHNVVGAGSDVLPSSQRDIGVAGHALTFNGAAPAKDLPQFRITCNTGEDNNATNGDENGFLFTGIGTSVVTNDPGKALITGLCKDVGSRTVPSLRALAAHEPYFSDGSALTLRDVVNFYNKRFSIGFTEAEKTDLVNFMNAL